MIASSVVLALAGGLALFAPLDLFGSDGNEPGLSVILQLLGSLFFALAFINWTARDSQIGGIHLRPISLGNLAHFLVGALVFGKLALANSQSPIILIAMSLYAIFAYFFWGLVFQASAEQPAKTGPEPD
jgi:hypothetical protein